MSHEARRMPRRTLTEPLDVVDTMTERSVGSILNLSVSGMLLIASTRLVEEALYQFRFDLPGGDVEPVEVGAHVLWRDDASAPGQSWVGLRFLGLAPETTRRLREWIAQDASAH